MPKRYEVAGASPATFIYRLRFVGAFGAFLLSGPTSLHAEMDERTRGAMQQLHKSLMLSEQNLAIAIEKRDYARAAIVNNLLWNINLHIQDDFKGSNSCMDALQGLSAASVAGDFFVHPVVDEIGDRFSKELRPPDDLMFQWFSDGPLKYIINISLCENDINTRNSKRLLPEKLPSVN